MKQRILLIKNHTTKRKPIFTFIVKMGLLFYLYFGQNLINFLW